MNLIGIVDSMDFAVNFNIVIFGRCLHQMSSGIFWRKYMTLSMLLKCLTLAFYPLIFLFLFGWISTFEIRLLQLTLIKFSSYLLNGKGCV